MSKQPQPQEPRWPKGTIFTVGRSTLPIERFLSLLHAYGIKTLGDIRSVARSRHPAGAMIAFAVAPTAGKPKHWKKGSKRSSK